MSDSVQMPALGESVTEGTVTRWLKQVGDRVEVDEPLLEVSTDKVDTEIPSPVAGVLEKIVVNEDETVDVGAELAVIGDGSSAEGDSDTADDQSEDSGEQESGGAQQDNAGEQQDEAGGEQEDEPAKDERRSGGSGGGGTPVTMPALGESVTEGTVTRWLKQEGDSVEVDEPLLEVSTDKVDTEIPSPVAGVVRKILVGEDETVEVGAELAMVGGEGASDDAGDSDQAEAGDSDGDDAAGDLAAEEQEQERAAEQSEQKSQPERSAPEPEQKSAEAEQKKPEPKQPEPAQEEPKQATQQEKQAVSEGSQGAGRSSGEASSYVTPLVRKLAAEHDVDLSSLSGTGVGGRIRKQDVLATAEETKAAKSATSEPEQSKQPASSGGELPAGVAAQRGTSEKMSRLRKVIAQRMVESLQVSAQLTTVVEVDVSKIARLRDRAKREFEAREGVKLSFLPFFAKASVEALGQHPKVNASLEDDQVVYHAQENLGIAVDTDRGLLVPVIRDAGDLNIAGLSRKISDLADRTRSSKITPDELGGGTFTLTNTGSRGALFDTPIINQPQMAILGTGAVVKRPVVVKDADGGETIAIRSMAYLALSYDHRLVDGADAARFLVTIKNRLEEGAFEGDLGL